MIASLGVDIDPALIIIAFVVAICSSVFLYYEYLLNKIPKPNQTNTLKPSKSNKKLTFKKLVEHTEEFKVPEILTLLDGKVHVAIGKRRMKKIVQNSFFLFINYSQSQNVLLLKQ